MAKELEDLVMSEGPETNAALLAEPMQSGGGAIHPPWDYWPAMQAVIRQFDNKTKQFRGSPPAMKRTRSISSPP